MTFTTDVRSAWDDLSGSQKSGAGVPWYMRVVNRRLGRVLAAVGARLGLVPDAMTALSALAFVAGAALFVALPPSFAAAVVVVLLLQLGFALDSADGQLARLTGRGSVAGEWLDHVVDAGRLLLFHLAVGAAIVRHTELSLAWLLLPAVFGWLASVRFFAQILAEQLHRAAPAQEVPAAPEPVTSRSPWIQLPADAGIVNAVLLLWPWTTMFLLGYGALAAATALLTVATFVRKRRALRAW
ncbi:hypothetical protein ASD11_12905 [Aeromicrobium sp. Root495]|uniref:CDP-alcohol phosphatidyltransferase family protein n=1 Tax=Aeromicrobium sp. Root495 TaxID=1736550 RepID=UPI0006FA571B|nr:CDP-alcohol phosphatidyltransferase family protein [Aeromicrobium sp. Root495]KQY60346.1 hypothetical protein ASD11_12905 [Aeromicrobium sp. Root495]